MKIRKITFMIFILFAIATIVMGFNNTDNPDDNQNINTNDGGENTMFEEIADNKIDNISELDIPDPSVIRVDDTYYMSSTTMHMNPGVPIMKSKDLVNWEIVNYAYDILEENDKLALKNGEDAYGNGSWASSLRYHDGTFYLAFSSMTTGSTYIYTTSDIENGSWKRSKLPFTHDMSLLFDDDRVYLVYGGTDIKLRELNEDATGFKTGSTEETIIPDAGSVAGSEFILNAEGAHIHKIDGMYYVFLISWPKGSGRTQIVYRSDNIRGPYEGKVVLDDSGYAQGGVFDTPEGDWYSMVFQDSGPVGRVPRLLPVTWEDGWPVYESSNNRIDLNFNLVSSDDFNYQSNNLALEWQWNHNPDNNYWSLTDRPGYLRLVTGRVDSSIHQTQNTLTQRTFGPESSAVVAVDISNMKNGDYAGLAAFQYYYGFVGAKMSEDSKSIVMVRASTDDPGKENSPIEIESLDIKEDRVYLKVESEFGDWRQQAYFYYSLDGEKWEKIGEAINMVYTIPHFMGYRFALFNYATKTTGGYVDFDYFKIDDTIMGSN